MYDLTRWCQNYDCSFKNMFQNLIKKVFQLTTLANDFIASIKSTGFPKKTDDYDTITKKFLKFGDAFGKIVRYSTDFDHKLLP